MNAMVQEEPTGKWEMKKLTPMHEQLCSMLAQGIDRQTIAKVLDITPEYVSMLAKQPLVQAYIKEMCQFASLQLEAQFVEGVKVIGDVMANGADKERLQAVRLNAELTHRIGSESGIPTEIINTNERLANLASRLLSLQERANSTLPAPVDGEFHEVQQEEVRQESLF